MNKVRLPLTGSGGFLKVVKQNLGFTLSELLIALAILGVIATFTIPKILQGQQNTKRVAVFKETMAAITNAHYDAVRENGLGSVGNCVTLMFDRINAIKRCPSDATAEGCWPSGGGATDPAMELANGATIGDIDGCSPAYGAGSSVDTLTIDWNGSLAPNAFGDDQMVFLLNVGTATTSVGQPNIAPMQFTGSIGPSKTLFEAIYSD